MKLIKQLGKCINDLLTPARSSEILKELTTNSTIPIEYEYICSMTNIQLIIRCKLLSESTIESQLQYRQLIAMTNELEFRSRIGYNN